MIYVLCGCSALDLKAFLLSVVSLRQLLFDFCTTSGESVIRHIFVPNQIVSSKIILGILKILLVARRATYVVDGRFFGHFFWKVEGTVRIHVNSRVAHVWLPYTVINVQGGGGKQTSENLENLEILKFA